jgi:acetoacetyl-CoA reductase
MKDRVALVTGGTGAIGTEICAALDRAGCRSVATCHNLGSEKSRAWSSMMRERGHEIELAGCEIGDFEATRAMIRDVESKVGPVDILVNAAGITRDNTLRKMTPEQWHDVISVNLDSVFNATRNVIEGMLERGYGRIINISSINGQKGQFGQANYSAAKAGMHGFTMAVAREVARKGITVNTVSPGYIDSPMIAAVPDEVRDKIRAEIPVGRFGTPEEIARVVAFLAAEESGFITGADIPVNGGQFIY